MQYVNHKMFKKQGLAFHAKKRPKSSGFTFVEIIISIALISVVSIGAISSILLAREIAEYDKQRIAAIAAARSFIEERARRDLFPTLSPISDVTLDNFNTPDGGDDLAASVSINLYNVNPDGTRGSELFAEPTTQDRIEVEVTISWNRTGRMSSRRVSQSLTTYVSPDL